METTLSPASQYRITCRTRHPGGVDWGRVPRRGAVRGMKDAMSLTRNDVLEVVAQYAGLLRSLASSRSTATRNRRSTYAATGSVSAPYAVGLRAHPRSHRPDGRLSVCVRYLGCIQGGLAACGLLTVAEIRRQFGQFIFERDWSPASPPGTAWRSHNRSRELIHPGVDRMPSRSGTGDRRGGALTSAPFRYAT